MSKTNALIIGAAALILILVIYYFLDTVMGILGNFGVI